MNFLAEHIDYKQTGYFSKLATDYIAADKKLQPFYGHPVSVEGMKASIRQRKLFNTDRALLHTVMQQQYSNTELSIQQKNNLQSLLNENTFTITTAHQPNIFTGPIFFIYKILHAIKLAAFLQKEIPENNFVPVYYMGSEDADLDELGHLFINGDKYEWKTDQTGAVGRMKVDKGLGKIIDQIEGQVAIHPFGEEIIGKIRNCYKQGVTIEAATFSFVNQLFSEYGLLILSPDNSTLKKSFSHVIEKELTDQFSHKAVLQTLQHFPDEYKVQASGREINLFYLIDDKRERIELKEKGKFKIENTIMSQAEMLEELKYHSERFSPNVILRPVFQETILPDIAFIGGGGELAYWLELKNVFAEVGVPYPVLILRNSFLLISAELQSIIHKLRIITSDLFTGETELLNQLVKRESSLQLNLTGEKENMEKMYAQIQQIAATVDVTLKQHVTALQHLSIKKLDSLEKKMIRAEKKKFETLQRQLNKIRRHLFPNNSLQERIDNFIPYYARYGQSFIDALYEHSLDIVPEFSVISYGQQV